MWMAKRWNIIKRKSFESIIKHDFSCFFLLLQSYTHEFWKERKKINVGSKWTIWSHIQSRSFFIYIVNVAITFLILQISISKWIFLVCRLGNISKIYCCVVISFFWKLMQSENGWKKKSDLWIFIEKAKEKRETTDKQTNLLDWNKFMSSIDL